MDFARADRAYCQNKIKGFNNGGIGWYSETHLVIKFPDPRIILHVISRSLFFALVILTLPCLVSILGRESGSDSVSLVYSISETPDFEQLDLLFRDLALKGLAINGHKALILSSKTNGLTLVRVLDDDERKLDIVVDSDFDQSGLLSDDSFDFVFASGHVDSDFMDRILRVGGIVAFPLRSNDPSNHFQKKSNYRPVFLNRYSSIIVAMEKTARSDQVVYASASRRRLLQSPSQTRKPATRRGLEDLPLEPPTKDIAKPNKLSRKIKFLHRSLEKNHQAASP